MLCYELRYDTLQDRLLQACFDNQQTKLFKSAYAYTTNRVHLLHTVSSTHFVSIAIFLTLLPTVLKLVKHVHEVSENHKCLIRNVMLGN